MQPDKVARTLAIAAVGGAVLILAWAFAQAVAQALFPILLGMAAFFFAASKVFGGRGRW